MGFVLGVGEIEGVSVFWSSGFMVGLDGGIVLESRVERYGRF